MCARKMLPILILLILLVAALPAVPLARTAPPDPLDKVEPLVLKEIETNGHSDFFVVLAEKADLSPAAHMQTKLEKGRFVYETLVATAERTQQSLRTALDAQGVRYKAFYIANKVLVYAGDQALLQQLAGRPDVAHIAANHRFQVEEPIAMAPAPNQVEAVEPNISFVRADQVWALGYTGQGTVLAGNDSGIDVTHPALARHYRGCVDPPACTTWDHNYNWWDATAYYPSAPYDDWYHGTHTTGTMVGDDGAANQIGMAPGAQMIHCRCFGAGWSTDAAFSECFQWDLAPWDLDGLNPRPDLAPDAVNNSWGGLGYDPAYEDEIAALQAAGILIEVSAHNHGPACGTLASPGSYAQVLTTGSVGHASPFPGTLTSWSSRGPSAGYPDDYIPDVMAPGENVRSSFPGGDYIYLSGTSMSGPHATALVGLVWSANPALRGQVALTQQIIKDTAAPLTGQGGSNCGGDYIAGPNNDWGYGTIDALAAVQLALAIGGDLAFLDGTVADAATAQPLPGAEVAVFDPYGFLGAVSTAAGGAFSISLSPGVYTVTAGTWGYITGTVGGVVIVTGTTTNQDLSLTALPAYTISGTVTAADTGLPLSATVRILGRPLPPAMADPATGFYSLTVPSGSHRLWVTAPTYTPAERPVLADHDRTESFALSPVPCVLLVDDDQDRPNVSSYYISALDGLGLAYDLWDTARVGRPTAADLEGYAIVIWFTGYPQRRTFADSEAAAAAYLDGGGRFFLSSADYLHDMGLTSFGMNYLGIVTYTGEVSETVLVGTPGSPIGDGLGPYTLESPGPLIFYADAVSGTAAPFQWQDSGQSNSANLAGSGFQTVFFGWPFEWLPELDQRVAVLGRIVEWFGGCPCEAAYAPGFTWSPEGPLVGQWVYFYGVAWGSPPFTYTWDLGDGTTAGGDFVGHPYSQAGDYTVVLTATNCATATATVTHTVNVACQEVTDAGFTWAPDEPVAGSPVTFTGTASSPRPVSYTWKLDVGSWKEGQVVTHTYDLPGTHTVIMTATNDCGAWLAVTDTVAVTCQEASILSVTAAISGCEVTLGAELSGDPPFTYLWDFGPFGTSTATNPLVDYSSSGIYAGTVSVWNCGNTEPALSAFTVEVACGWQYRIYLPLVSREAP